MNAARVVGVLSASGGAGSSVLAGLIAARAGGRSLLVDCDPLAGGLDVLLGCEQAPGVRWGQVRLGGGELSSATVSDALPRWGQVSVLAADSAADVEPAAVRRIVAAASDFEVVVLDLPRAPVETRTELAGLCDLLVLVCAAQVRPLTAAALVLPTLPRDRTVLAMAGAMRSLTPASIGRMLEVEVVGVVPRDGFAVRSRGLDPSRARRGTVRLVNAILRRAEDLQCAA